MSNTARMYEHDEYIHIGQCAYGTALIHMRTHTHDAHAYQARLHTYTYNKHDHIMIHMHTRTHYTYIYIYICICIYVCITLACACRQQAYVACLPPYAYHRDNTHNKHGIIHTQSYIDITHNTMHSIGMLTHTLQPIRIHLWHTYTSIEYIYIYMHIYLVTTTA